MRVFVALDLGEGIRNNIVRFVDEMRSFAPAARWITPESLHVTLKFIGEKPDPVVTEIEKALHSIRVVASTVRFRDVGFFPTPKAPRVFWAGIEGDPSLGQLAATIEDTLAKIGIAKEQRAFSPHLTLARASGGSSGAPGWRKGDKVNRQFARLQQELSQQLAPDFGTMSAHEFFLYRSQLSSKGSQYTKIARFGLHSMVE